MTRNMAEECLDFFYRNSILLNSFIWQEIKGKYIEVGRRAKSLDEGHVKSVVSFTDIRIGNF